MGGNSSKPPDKSARPQQDKKQSKENGRQKATGLPRLPQRTQRPGVLKPAPPSTKRRDIFNKDSLKQATQNASLEVSAKDLNSYDSLVSRLTEGLKDDVEKAWVFYLWVVNLDLKSQETPKSGAKNTPKGDLKEVRNGKTHITDFFTSLCSNGGLKCKSIEGFQKDDNFEIGWTEKRLVEGKWNAIYIRESWRLLHLEYGMSTNQKWKSLYFFIDPEDLIHWCYPHEMEWQLLSTSIPKQDFLSMPNCRRKCLEMGVKIIQPALGKVKVDQGRISVEVFIDKTYSQNTVLSYTLRGKKVRNGNLESDTRNAGNTTARTKNGKLESETPGNTGNTTARTKNGKLESDTPGNTTARTDGKLTDRSYVEKHEKQTMEDTEVELADKPNPGFPSDLEKYVFMNRADSRVVFDVAFPVPGSYVLDIEGKTFSLKGGHNTMSVICQFKFACVKCVPRDDENVPLADVPKIGWGPTPHCIRYGVRPVSHGYGTIYIQPSEPVKVRFEYTGKYEFKTDLISMNQSSWTESNPVCTVSPNKLTVEINVPEEGHYALKVFARKDGDSDFINIINYMLIYNRKNANVEKFNKRMMRERLLKATENGTEQDVDEALQNFLFHRVPDQGEVQKAKRKLKTFEAKRELGNAMQRRNVKVLEAAIENAENSPNMDGMKEDIKKAKGLLNRLRNLEGSLHPITKMENNTLSEIRRYSNPTPAVKDVLTATYIILGHDIESARKWDYIQSQLAKTGRDGLQSSVIHCDVDSVSRMRAEIADQLLKPLNQKTIRDASTGAASIFQWASEIVEVKLKESEKEPETSTEIEEDKTVEPETKRAPKRSSITSRNPSLRSVQPKVDSVWKKGDKAIIPKRHHEEVVRTSSDRFVWPKR